MNCCLYDEPGDVDFVEDAGTVGGSLDEYHPALLDCARRVLGTAPGLPPPTGADRRSVLREYGVPPVVDYWSLDTEGAELVLLQSFPFDDFDVRVLTGPQPRCGSDTSAGFGVV
ncbi:hypothetical protein [Streptomyces sp. NPDC012508]|uniref:hypothetical protein n=1 Tax=Streptomyces sp. NPDC012508 TaxID=3364837 RepID=UPI0036B4FB8D